MEILFSKYNRNRLPEYQLATYIIKEKDRMFALKAPLIPEANKHVKNIFKNYDKLKKQYKNLILAGTDLKEGRLWFEYIEGTSLDIVLLNHIKNKDIAAFHNTIQSYINFLKSLGTITQEKILDGRFEEIFGLCPELFNVECLEVPNIDLTFENLIVCNDSFTGIDYEWVFDFPIPLEYIIFRSLNMFYWKFGDYLHHYLPIEEMYIKYSINHLDIYNEMEIGFQKYVLGENASINEKYLKYSKHLNDLVLENSDFSSQLSKLKDELNHVLNEKEQEIKEITIEKEQKVKDLTNIINEIESIISKQKLELERFDMEMYSKEALINEKEQIITSLKSQNLASLKQIELLNEKILNEINRVVEKNKDYNFFQKISSYFNKSLKDAKDELSVLKIKLVQIDIEKIAEQNKLNALKKESDAIINALKNENKSLKDLNNARLIEKNQLEVSFQKLARTHHSETLELNHVKEMHHRTVLEKLQLEHSLQDLQRRYHELHVKLNKS